ncbi:hypothetical protein EMIT0180MI3_11210 [Priestia megaterium]
MDCYVAYFCSIRYSSRAWCIYVFVKKNPLLLQEEDFFMSETLTQTKNSSAYVYIGEYIRKRKQYKKIKVF